MNGEDELEAFGIRPMTSVESNLMTQVLALRRELAAANAEVERLRAASPVLEPCQSCHGRGSWETECCNGSGGCPCRGGLVEMGSCHACGGRGQVEEQNPWANFNHIQQNHISYPGGGPR